MSVILDPDEGPARAAIPLVAGDGGRTIAFAGGRVRTVSGFRDDVARLAGTLPSPGAMVNLCEDRYRFLVAFAAAIARGHPVLLPGSRAPEVVAEVLGREAHAYRCDDATVDASSSATPVALAEAIDPAFVAVHGYTSGSTGVPKRHAKRWGAFAQTTRRNADCIASALLEHGHTGQPQVVATVPPQHMYGIETSVLLPLVGGLAVHAGKPL